METCMYSAKAMNLKHNILEKSYEHFNNIFNLSREMSFLGKLPRKFQAGKSGKFLKNKIINKKVGDSKRIKRNGKFSISQFPDKFPDCAIISQSGKTGVCPVRTPPFPDEMVSLTNCLPCIGQSLFF